MPSQDHVKDAMQTLLKIFEDGNLEKVARAVFKGGDIPADKWSFLNHLLMYFNNTEEKVNESGEKCTVESNVLVGFKAVPVFRFEDTDGAPIISEGLKLDIPFEFNGLIQELGLKVDAVRFNGAVYGSYNPVRKEIKLASPEIEIFLHELSHAVDDRLNGLIAGQHKDQEVTAEFSGAVIGHLMGYKVSMGNVKEYIEHYSFKELMSCLGRIEKVVTYVIDRTKVMA